VTAIPLEEADMVPRPRCSTCFKPFFLTVSLFAMAFGCDDKPRADDYGDGNDTDTAAALPLAAGVTMTAIELYQAVLIPVMTDGEGAGDSGVTVIAGKDAFVRVYVQYDSGFEARELYLRVELLGGETVESANALIDVTDEMIAVPSAQENVSSTLNVLVPGDIIQGGRTLVVSLRETSEDEGSGDNPGAIWPAEGEGYDLGIAEETAPTKLVLVPVEYNADGSGRLPDTSEAMVESYAELFSAMYPISGIEITVDAPMPYSGNVAAMGNGWDGLLSAVMQRRTDNAAGNDEFYYGLVAPADAFSGPGGYCPGGCVTGLSNLSGGPGASQVGCGIGYSGSESTYTAAHEVGHTFGRSHAPGCGAAGPFDGYPYDTGLVGVFGYDPTESIPDFQKLKSPETYYDIMSYCTPQWISDFTYMGLYERVEQIAQLPSVSPPPGGDTTWLTVFVGTDGTAERGPTLDSALPFEGELRRVSLLDAKGALVDEVDGVFLPRADLGGGLVAFRNPAPTVTAGRVVGYPAVDLR
jgi:hypothetical protein